MDRYTCLKSRIVPRWHLKGGVLGSTLRTRELTCIRVSMGSDGKLALIDVRKLLKSTSRLLMKHQNRKAVATIEPPQRMLDGSGCSLFSVDIGADRIVCGGEEHIVKLWDFSCFREINEISCSKGYPIGEQNEAKKAPS